MSRGVVYSPVCSGGATLVAKTGVVKTVVVVYPPVCAIPSGAQTAVTGMPSTG